jgi:cytochrome c-type protein NapC
MASWILNNLAMVAAIACAAASALLVLWFLVARPALTNAPIATAVTGNVSGYEATKSRTFCGSCHVMKEYSDDSADPDSTTLAARHGRNALFGDANCYGCHADYGMFGTVTTKLGGLRHVYEYTFHYHQMSPEEARAKIHIRTPFQNATCMHCHSTEVPLWKGVPEHASLLPRLRDGSVSCASAGCHGPAHPFSKVVAR